jgi:hypothetical protein
VVAVILTITHPRHLLPRQKDNFSLPSLFVFLFGLRFSGHTTSVEAHDVDKHDVETKGYGIGSNGSLSRLGITTSALGPYDLGHMISLEGIVTCCSLIRPRMLKSVHYCPDSIEFYSHEYRDHDATSATSNLLLPPLLLRRRTNRDVLYRSSMVSAPFVIINVHQRRIGIQEMPERARGRMQEPEGWRCWHVAPTRDRVIGPAAFFLSSWRAERRSLDSSC